MVVGFCMDLHVVKHQKGASCLQASIDASEHSTASFGSNGDSDGKYKTTTNVAAVVSIAMSFTTEAQAHIVS